MAHPSPVYESRYGWHRRSVLGVVAGLVPTALAVALRQPVWFIVVITVLTGGTAFLIAVVVAGSRRVAVRIDDHGVTLGRVPLPTGSRTQVVPWGDIESIRVWHLRLAGSNRSRGRYLSVDRRAGAPPLIGHPDVFRPQHVALEIPPASKRLSWCELDPARLQAAAAAFAPEVRIILED
ncbi:hypothetical protein [Peterkaempfera bronchialis]|uniref:Uncharacterized protein n=1 Tax=Peterkaempfera bronchialis TaxID=2126346 RepID=A0A345T4Q4_9ACTN|nr:hypothetical protein [Peterkaempfera bronchialis]AXI80959.1 hypothetical protein C7M71_029830 [Peterkaempfera bronchialis]